MTQAAATLSPASMLRPRDAIYRSLKRRILLNELKPETALTELGLAQDMGCSQGTVREALLRLQEEGLVQRSGHRGTSVTPLDAVVAGEMIALRRQIETRGALHADGRIDAATVSELTLLLGEMDAAAAQADEFRLIEADICFHMTLFRAAGFRALEQILHRVMLHSHRQKLWEPRHRRSLHDTAARHRAILDAIPRGGAALAEALGGHIDTIVDVLPAQQVVPTPRVRMIP